MTAVSKAANKTKFQTGDVPSQADFEDLIDSYQDTNQNLVDIAGATFANDDFPQKKAGVITNRTVAQVKTDLGLTGTNSGDETAARIGTIVNGATNYVTPLDADKVGIWDTANSLFKAVTWANIKATLNSIYQAVLVSGTNIKTINGTSVLGSGDISVGGSVADGSTTVAGKFEAGTDAEIIAGTAVGGTGALLVMVSTNIAAWWTNIKTLAQTFAGIITFSSAINEAKWTDIASAATTDLGAANGNYGDVTGTTTITALGTIVAGTRRTATFTGILTLTHSGNIILPTAANIITAAGDTAIFISRGSGVWKCVSYTRATGQPLASANVLQTNLLGFAPNTPVAYAATINIDLTGKAVSDVSEITGINNNFTLNLNNATSGLFGMVILNFTASGTFTVTLGGSTPTLVHKDGGAVITTLVYTVVSGDIKFISYEIVGTTAFQVTENNLATIIRQGGNALATNMIIGTSDAGTDLVLQTNSIERFRLNNAGSISFTGAALIRLESAGAGFAVKEGTNARMGLATLVAGTVTVSTTAVTTANSRIRLIRQGINGSTALGELVVGTVTNVTSFVINSVIPATPASLTTGDTSIVLWEIIDKL